MTPTTPGLHHVSAIAGDPQENVDFYVETLGLHPVKRTVNFDEKFMYHLYYGDAAGTPGTLLTFFPFERGQVGRVGKPQPQTTAFAIPAGSAEYWHERLESRGVDVDSPTERFDETVVAFRDHDGNSLELVTADSPLPRTTDESVPTEHAIRGFHGVTLLSASVYHTASALEVLGYELVDQEGDRVRYRAPGDAAAVVDLLDVDAEYGKEGAGTVHHVAFRRGDASLAEWRDRLDDAGMEPTRIKDRFYFESVYVREPGGILFEIASDEPGFAVDEDPAEFGASLRLPPWFEEDREMIEGQLPPIDLPRAE
ncbi:ring-cleaving dioxygenase [Halostella sp. JP-L12]|nr:ring-cleaving dioxygenase [Halostella limicola]NHN49464.1 ring-cleaving dioxygenase [Halostella sp. JP-L12]